MVRFSRGEQSLDCNPTKAVPSGFYGDTEAITEPTGYFSRLSALKRGGQAATEFYGNQVLWTW